MRHSVAAAVVMWLLVAPGARADVRPVSEAERAAVQLAAEYLHGGAGALLDDLAAASPLRKLAAPAIPLEIETRLGPPAGAEWRLVTVVEALKDKAAAFDISYPSGLDETVFFEMVNEGGAWKIADLRIMAMPSARKPLFAAAAPAESKPETTPAGSPALPYVIAAAVVFGGVALILMRARPFVGRFVYIFCLLLVGGALALMMRKSGEPATTARISADDGQVRLASLIAVRRALAAGSQDAGAALASVPKSGLAADVAKLWKAQWDLNQMKVAEVTRTLDAFPSPSDVPLVEILRARLALVENRPERAVVAYENAINAGPGRDSLWREMSVALMAGGFDEMAKKNLTRLIDVGSREPNVYYAQASLAERAEELDAALKKAWNLQPASRDRLVESGMLWSLVRKKNNAFINLSDPHEPRFASRETGTRPIAMPDGAVSRVSGDYLHISIDTAQLAVPGGAALAPAGAIWVGADEWTRLAEERAMQDVPAFLESPPTAGSYMQPALRQRITNSADALASRNRWPDVVTLTSEISPKSEFVPESLFFLRAEALQRLKRSGEAKRLLIDLASSPALLRKRNAYSLEALGEMLSSFDEYEAAMKVFDRARRIRPSPYQEIRVTQIAMDQKLAQDYLTYSTPHFEIHYPQELPSGLAERLGNVLEGELKRLQAWIPVPNFEPVVVNVVWWQDFKSVYTGSEDILGFYNGKITLPLAGIGDFVPEIVAIVTHELAHAMIAQATNDQAPRWFHEGLAQRVSMVEYHANAFNMYDDDKLFAVSVLDPVLHSSRDPDMIGAAYIVSQTLIRFIEERYGPAGIRKLLASYAEGDRAIDALTSMSGSELAAFNTAFRDWGKSERRVFANKIAVRYDEQESERMTRRSPVRGSMVGGTFGGKKP